MVWVRHFVHWETLLSWLVKYLLFVILLQRQTVFKKTF